MLSTDKQTNRQTNATKNITSFAKEVKHYKHSESADLLGRGRSLLSYIAHCKNVEPWLWKTTPPIKKGLDHYLHHDMGMLPLLWCFFCSFTHLTIPRSPPNLISSALYYSGPLHKISSQSVHNFLSNVVHRQTDKQTNKPTLPKT